MSTVQQIKLTDETYKRLYKEQEEELSYLKEFIKGSSLKEIKETQQERDSLKIENSNLKGQVEQLKNTVRVIREQADKRVEQAEKRVAIEKDREYSQKLTDKGKNERRSIREKEVKPVEQKLAYVESERDRISEMYNSLLTEFNVSHENERLILETCREILERVRDKVNDRETKEAITKEITNLSKVDIEQECREIHRLLEEGKTQKEVANIMYPDVKRREVKVSARVKSKTYIKMYGDSN